MATANPTPTLRFRKTPRCPCGEALHWWKGEPFCPACTTFSPAPAQPTVEVTVVVGGDDLLQMLHDSGWDVVTGREHNPRVYHPAVRTAAEARLTLRRGGFDGSLFAVSE